MSMAGKGIQDKAFTVWVNKDQKSEQAANDVSKYTAFQKVKSILGDIQDKQKPLQETIDTLNEALTSIKSGAQPLTEAQARVIKTLYAQMSQMLDEVHGMVQELGQQAGIVTSVSSSSGSHDFSSDSQDSGNSGGETDTLAITSGMQAMAQSILAQLQAEFNQLNQIYNQIRKNTVQNSTAMVSVQANAAMNVGSDTANIDIAEMYSSIGQAGTSAVSLYKNVSYNNAVKAEVAAPTAQLAQMNKFQSELNAPNGAAASGAAGDVKLADLKPADTNYLNQLKNGNFSEPAAGSGVNKEAVLSYIRGTPNDQQAIMKQLNEKSTQASSQIQAAYSRNQQKEMLLNAATQGLNAAFNAGAKGYEAVQESTKGGDSAAQGTSQTILQQNEQTATASSDAARAATEQATGAIRAREAVQQYNAAKAG
jgi:hypothetical protein